MNQVIRNLIASIFFLMIWSCAQTEKIKSPPRDCAAPNPLSGAQEVDFDRPSGHSLKQYFTGAGWYNSISSTLISGQWLHYQIKSASQPTGVEVWVVDHKVFRRAADASEVEDWGLGAGEIALQAQFLCEKVTTDISGPVRIVFPKNAYAPDLAKENEI